MKGVDLVVSDEYADVVVSEVYDASAEAYDYVAHAIPSIEDLRSEFCAEFRRCAPGCEISAAPFNQRHLIVRDETFDQESIISRRKLYGKARVDMMQIHAGGAGLVDHVRGACLLAARKMAAGVATMTTRVHGGAREVRWTGGGPLHWPGIAYSGRPRVAVEFNRDSIVLLLASYYVLVPVGCTVAEPAP